jgi:hypothetical protein
MEPDTFLAQDDVHLLVQALNTFALEVDAAADRKHMLVNAGIHPAFLSKLNFGTSPSLFANALVAHFREYRVSERQQAYHPMFRLLDYLLKVHELEDQDRRLFQRLHEQCLENLEGLAARGAVGRIESPPGTARGTGVLLDGQLLLTCKHVIERIFDNGQERIWVRFGYKEGKYGIEAGEIFELDVQDMVNHDARADSTLDYVLAKISGKPTYRAASLSNNFLSAAQHVRLVHHPRGEPVQISDVGRVVQVDQEYVKHDIQADYGSSGAPIFDMNWRVVAIHRGKLNLSRSYAPGETEGIPIRAIWNTIEPHLSMYANC